MLEVALNYKTTVKPVLNSHARPSHFTVAFIERWSLNTVTQTPLGHHRVAF